LKSVRGGGGKGGKSENACDPSEEKRVITLGRGEGRFFKYEGKGGEGKGAGE